MSREEFAIGRASGPSSYTPAMSLVDTLPDAAVVLDVGGWAAPAQRADWVLDVLPYETSNWFYRERGETPPPGRVTRERWVEQDACVLPWPFEDDFFDYVICSQTLEDVRDPVAICREMTRVGKAGYIASPGPIVELTRGVESPLYCGWRHHRWLLDRDGDGIVFIVKPHHVHSPLWPSVRTPKLWQQGAESFTFEWNGDFTAREDVLLGPEFDARLAAIIRRDALDDLYGERAREARVLAWNGYRQLRSLAGRALRG